MRILITGANGYIGSRLCQYLNNQGHEIIAVCKSKVPYTYGWSDKIKNIIIGDLILEQTIDKIVNVRPNIVIHLVSLDQEDSKNSINNAIDINVKITWKLLDRLSSLNVEKFINFSTIHASKIFQDKLNLRDNYALTHYLSEKICNYFNAKTNINCINIRLANSYGQPIFKNSKCWDLIINDLVKMAYTKKSIILKSDGSSKRNFIHFKEICSKIKNLLDNRLQINDQFIFMKSNNSYHIIQVALLVKRIFNDRYNQFIPVFIKGNQLIKEEEFDQSYLNDSRFLHLGINDLFTYMENNF